MKYIHYGSDKFDINKFEIIENRAFFPKPTGGLWASRIDAIYSWKDWCIKENFCTDSLNEYFIFSLQESAKVLTIDNTEKLKNLPKTDDIVGGMYITLDFEKLSKEYDAIEVLISEDPDLYFSLYGWDCDSIVIMNPNIIILEQEENK